MTCDFCGKEKDVELRTKPRKNCPHGRLYAVLARDGYCEHCGTYYAREYKEPDLPHLLYVPPNGGEAYAF